MGERRRGSGVSWRELIEANPGFEKIPQNFTFLRWEIDLIGLVTWKETIQSKRKNRGWGVEMNILNFRLWILNYFIFGKFFFQIEINNEIVSYQLHTFGYILVNSFGKTAGKPLNV